MNKNKDTAWQKLNRLIKTCRFNIVNSFGYIFLSGKLPIESAYKKGIWENWCDDYSCRPNNYYLPETEEEICQIIKKSKKVRVVGGGHSFNESPLCEDTIISLDKYKKILQIDQKKKIVRLQTGIRLFELTEILQNNNFALPVLGSTNHQSIGGLIATDLHGTGKDHGFLSEQILSLRIVDGLGRAKTFRKGSPVFHAAIGGIGLCGIVTEVELQCVENFQLVKTMKIIDRLFVKEGFEIILANNDHVSFYYFGGTNHQEVRVNMWNHTKIKASKHGIIWKRLIELIDMSCAGFLLGAAEFLQIENLAIKAIFAFGKSGLSRREAQVYKWHDGFPRTLFFRHDEIEIGIPAERFPECIKDVLDMLSKEKFVTIIEVRFSPNNSEALIGPGVGRRTCYIELAASTGKNQMKVFKLFEKILLKYGGQPHMGKKIWMKIKDFKRIYGSKIETFLTVRKKQDPKNKFVNKFANEIFSI